MSQDRLSGLVLISIEYEAESHIDYDIMHTFAYVKARKVNCKFFYVKDVL